MKRIFVWAALATIVLAGSCVPIRKVTYLQNKDVSNRMRIPTDSIVRTHPLNISEYRIQPLDMLSVNFETLNDEKDAFNFLPKLTQQPPNGGAQAGNNPMIGIFVNTDGEIEYAVLGKIHLAGLTIFEAERAIQRVASNYVTNVVVRVRMLNFRYTVLGEVNAEKVVTSTNPRLTLMEAIGMAGGLSELADRSKVKVVRQKGSTSEVYYVNLLKEEFIESPFYFVQQNDVIIVPPLYQRTFRRYFTTNLALVSSLISFGLLVYTLTNKP